MLFFGYHYLLAFSFVLLIKCLKILEDAVINPIRKDGALDSILSNRKKFSIDSSPPLGAGLSNGVKENEKTLDSSLSQY